MKSVVRVGCCLLFSLGLVSPNFGQTDANQESTPLQQHLESVIPQSNDLLLVVYPKRLTQSPLWSMFKGPQRDRFTDLLPADPSDVAAVAVSSSSRTFHKWNDRLKTLAPGSLGLLGGATQMPDGQGGTDLESIKSDGDKNIVVVVQFVEDRDLNFVHDWIKSAPTFLFGSQEAHLDFERKEWHGHELLINEHGNSLCVLQLDQRSIALLRPQMLQQIFADANDTGDRGGNNWVSPPLTSNSAEVIFACKLDNFLKTTDTQDFGQFEVIRHAKTSTFWLDTSDSNLASLNLVFDHANNAKSFKRKLAGVHRMFGAVIAMNVAQMAENGTSKDQQWIGKKVVEVYKSIRFQSDDKTVSVVVPRPSELSELFARVVTVQNQVARKQKAKFEETRQLLSDP